LYAPIWAYFRARVKVSTKFACVYDGDGMRSNGGTESVGMEIFDEDGGVNGCAVCERLGWFLDSEYVKFLFS